MANWAYQFLDKVIGLEPKRRWRQLQARKKALPESYGEALAAVQRYTYVSGVSDGEAIMALHEELVTMFEEAASNGTPIRDLVGDDPTEFIDVFAANYKDRDWKTKYRDRLRDTINRVADDQSNGDPAPKNQGDSK